MDRTSDNDEVDGSCLVSKAPPVDAVISGSVFDAVYSMKYKNRGKCLIFNHKDYQPHTDLKRRSGTDADACRLYCLFHELQFEVLKFDDLTVDGVKRELKKAASEDHTNNSCFVCCILSHGDRGVIFAADGDYPTDSVFLPFRGDACPSLAGKPKIFFIQACQGKDCDSGLSVDYQESADSSDKKYSTFKIPVCADFLIAYATFPGYVAWKHHFKGAWFIQALCEAIKAHKDNMDLLSILTIVNFKVAYGFESRAKEKELNRKKQIPMISHTLTRMIMFN